MKCPRIYEIKNFPDLAAQFISALILYFADMRFYLLLLFCCFSNMSLFTPKSDALHSLREPDYSQLHDWAAHPRKKDMADSVAAFFAHEQRDSTVDVFFMHPTSFTHNLATAPWNASLDDEKLNQATDMGSMLNQASIFNAHARVYAPRYRQAHLKAFFMQKNANRQPAFDLAYNDLKKAFLHYMQYENNGRPIVIAAHSQGSMHAIRLLQELFDGKPLQEQLVCAYLVGWPVRLDDFKHIPLGIAPEQTGCFVSWRTYAYGHIDRRAHIVRGKVACVNPVTWSNGTAQSDPTQHKGAVHKNLQSLMQGLLAASVQEKEDILWVKIDEKKMEKKTRMKNYHVADLNLFYADVRENVNLRIRKFLAQH